MKSWTKARVVLCGVDVGPPPHPAANSTSPVNMLIPASRWILTGHSSYHGSHRHLLLHGRQDCGKGPVQRVEQPLLFERRPHGPSHTLKVLTGGDWHALGNALGAPR